MGDQPGHYRFNALTLGCHSQSGEARKLFQRKTPNRCMWEWLLLSARWGKAAVWRWASSCCHLVNPVRRPWGPHATTDCFGVLLLKLQAKEMHTASNLPHFCAHGDFMLISKEVRFICKGEMIFFRVLFLFLFSFLVKPHQNFLLIHENDRIHFKRFDRKWQNLMPGVGALIILITPHWVLSVI